MPGRIVNLIGFKECKFTVKQTHLEAEGKKVVKVKSSKIRSLFVSECNRIEFENCRFLPSSQKSSIEEFIRSNYSNTPMKFVNCAFKQRGSTLFEKIIYIFRPINFDLYFNGIAEVQNYTFRLKDIPRVESRILSDVTKM